MESPGRARRAKIHSEIRMRPMTLDSCFNSGSPATSKAPRWLLLGGWWSYSWLGGVFFFRLVEEQVLIGINLFSARSEELAKQTLNHMLELLNPPGGFL